MLGFSSISSAPISGLVQNATATILSAAATVAFTFGGAATSGVILSGSTTGGLTFSGAATWRTLNSIAATAGLTFGGNPTLRLAGHPIIITAIAESFVVRADNVSFQTIAASETFAARGVPE